MSQPYDHLIDYDLINAAKDRHQAALARASKARADLNGRRNSHVAARIACERAVADPTKADPHAADQSEAVASRAVGVAERVAAAAEADADGTRNAVRVASGEAHKPVYKQGVLLRLAAARKTDDARAMLADAEREYAEATELLNAATAAGTSDVVFDAAHSHALTDHATEAALWGRNFHNAWWPGLSVDGGVL